MCDLTNPEWLSLQPPEYQRSVWLGRAATRHEFAQKASNPEEARLHHLAAAEFERNAYEAMRVKDPEAPRLYPHAPRLMEGTK